MSVTQEKAAQPVINCPDCSKYPCECVNRMTEEKAAPPQTHTPGPWEAHGGSYLPIVAIVNGKSAQIGRAESCGQISDEECEANGRLIAAAPELLKFVEDYLASTNCICRMNEIMKAMDVHVPCTNCEAKALIAKARGRQL